MHYNKITYNVVQVTAVLNKHPKEKKKKKHRKKEKRISKISFIRIVVLQKVMNVLCLAFPFTVDSLCGIE